MKRFMNNCLLAFMRVIIGSIIPELQNRFTHCEVTSRVTNFIIFLNLFFELVTRCEKIFNIVLELVAQDF